MTHTFDIGASKENIHTGIIESVDSKYRLYHEVEVSTRFTHRGPQARGCVNRVETDTE